MKEKCKYGMTAGGGCELGFPGCACMDDFMLEHTGACQIYAGMDPSYVGSEECNCEGEPEWEGYPRKFATKGELE